MTTRLVYSGKEKTPWRLLVSNLNLKSKVGYGSYFTSETGFFFIFTSVKHDWKYQKCLSLTRVIERKKTTVSNHKALDIKFSPSFVSPCLLPFLVSIRSYCDRIPFSYTFTSLLFNGLITTNMYFTVAKCNKCRYIR